MLSISDDVQEWVALSSWRNWQLRHDIDERISDHENKLNSLAGTLSLATVLQMHDKILELQESLKNNSTGSADRKKAEEQIYRLRSAAPGEFTDLTPPELACEYLVASWMRKGDVMRYLEADRDRHRKCIPLIVDIARGLDYLHNQDIMHGSLKPSNILINDDGRAVLSDFSLAKAAVVGARNTQINLQVNVFRYQALEVISDEPISTASDVWSWAMTSLEIITG
ncbi:hypothetical protein FRC01_009242, partial [Tulasnella sp. 417]